MPEIELNRNQSGSNSKDEVDSWIGTKNNCVLSSIYMNFRQIDLLQLSSVRIDILLIFRKVLLNKGGKY